MENVHYYNTTVKWTEGRKGELIEPTMPTIEVATPPNFLKEFRVHGHQSIFMSHQLIFV